MEYHFIVAFAPWSFVFVFMVYLSENSGVKIAGVKIFLLWIGVIVCIVCYVFL